MNDQIKKIKKERKSIINDYSSHPIENTYLEEKASKINQKQQVLIKEIILETKDTKSFILVPDKERGTEFLLPFLAGQYISVELEIDKKVATRAYSLSSSPKEVEKGIYRITIKKVPDGLVSNYFFDFIKVGDHLTVSAPSGDFGYNRVRDEENVIGIAGGSGITPFMSLAKAIEDGIYSCDLTIFYSARTEEDIIFKQEIEEINKKSKKVKFVITLTREKKDKYLNGHINKIMMESYMKEFNTVLMCGPKDLYKAMNEILSEFNIPKKNVHYENFFLSFTPDTKETFTLKVITRNEEKEILCKSDETLLTSMENAGIKAPSLCRVGECGFCRSILVEGKVKMIGGNLSRAEGENNYIHPCITYPESNIIIKLDI